MGQLARQLHVGGAGFLEACTRGYYNNEGHPKGGSGFLGAYTPGPAAFNRLLMASAR